jgi:RNA polymerase-binding transcription factor
MDENQARESLRAERADLQRVLRDTEKAADEDLHSFDGPGDEVDVGQELAAEANDNAVVGDLRARLDAIDRALARLEAGTYGKSVLSGKPIPEERLEADPAAELTIEEARARR